jgi:acyl-CoA synthetase (NDP forming)
VTPRANQAQQLKPLLRPRSVAVVGASPRPGSAGSNIVENLLASGYAGPIYPINPRYPEIHGRKAYGSLADVGAEIDAVFIAVAAEHGPGLMRQAVEAGARAVLLNATGYADGDAAGKARQAEIAGLAAEAGIPVCGPNNLGLINIADRIPLWTSAHLPAMRAGQVAIISQSGSVALALGEDVAGLGLSYLITAGNEAVTGVGDYLEALAEDPRVRVVLLFLEAIRNPQGLAKAAAKARAAGQTVLAMKVGRSGKARAAVAAHSGALSGEDAVVSAFFRKHGITRAHDLDDLAQIAKLRLRPRPTPGSHAAFITLSGGQGAAVADAADDAGLELMDFPAKVAAELAPYFGGQPPHNPCDAWGLGWDAERVGKILGVLAGADGIDPIVFTLDVPSTGHADGPMAVEMAEIAAREPDIGRKAIFVANSAISGVKPELKEACDAAGLPILLGIGGALRALSEWSAPDRPVELPAEAPATKRPAANREAVEARLREIVRFVESRRASDPDEAACLAESWGYPVVLKGLAPAIAHKTELGLVRLGLSDAAAVRAAFTEVRTALDASAPGGTIEVQPMIGAGLELLVAARRDPLFGPVVVAGAGGKLVELLADTALRIGAVSNTEAGEMLAETRIGKLLSGYRDAIQYDEAAACAAIAGVSLLMAEAGPDVTAVEINPLILLPKGKGAIAVDLLIE